MTFWHRIWSHPVSALLSFILLAWVAWVFKEIIILVFAAMLLTLCLLPVINKLEKWKVPRALSVPVTMLAALLAIVGIFTYIVPPVINQLVALATTLPDSIRRIHNLVDHRIITQGVQSISGYAQQLGHTALDLTGRVVHLFSVLGIIVFMSIYWLIDYKTIRGEFQNIGR